jgi:hypothetical protein
MIDYWRRVIGEWPQQIVGGKTLSSCRFGLTTKAGINGHAPRTYDQKEDASKKHGKIDTRLVSKGPESLLQQHWNLRARDCHKHIDDHGNRSQPAQKTNQKEESTQDLAATYKWRHHLGPGNSDLDEPTDTEFHRKQKLLNPLGEEDRTDNATDQKNSGKVLR